jgi:hypothetical protein
MKELTFAFDVQISDQEDWIPEGTVVKVSENPFHLNRWQDSTPVIITEYYTYNGEVVEVTPYVEWFANDTFK